MDVLEMYHNFLLIDSNAKTILEFNGAEKVTVTYKNKLKKTKKTSELFDLLTSKGVDCKVGVRSLSVNMANCTIKVYKI